MYKLTHKVTSSLLALLLGCALSACSSTGSDSTSQANQAAQTSHTSNLALAQDDDKKVVCKSVKETGTRIGSRECRTREDWEKIRRDSKAYAENIQTKSAHTNLGDQ